MKKAILFVFVIFAICTLTQAQENWTLERCINEAIKNNLSIEESNLNLEFNKEDLKFARSAKHPSLNGTSSLGWNFGRTIDPTTNTFITKTFFSNNYGLNSAVNIYNGGLINHQIKQAEIESKASKEDLLQMERDIALQTALFYLNVVFSEENLTLAQKQIKISEDQLLQLDKLIEAGMRPVNDRLDLEVQLIQGEQSIILAENSYDLNMLQLKQLMRINMDQEIKLLRPGKIETVTDPDLICFEELYNQAIRHQPGVVASELRLASAQSNIDIAESAYYPSLSAFGNLQSNYSNQGLTIDDIITVREEQTAYVDGVPITFGVDVKDIITSKAKYFDQITDNVSYGFGLGLNIPIYNKRSVKNGVAKAQLSAQSSSINLERVKENLKVTVQQALIDARAAKRKFAASAKSMEAREMAYNNALKKYEIGATNSFELTGLQTQMESAEITHLIDRFDYLFKIKVIEFYLGKPIKL